MNASCYLSPVALVCCIWPCTAIRGNFFANVCNMSRVLIDTLQVDLLTQPLAERRSIYVQSSITMQPGPWHGARIRCLAGADSSKHYSFFYTYYILYENYVTRRFCSTIRLNQPFGLYLGKLT